MADALVIQTVETRQEAFEADTVSLAYHRFVHVCEQQYGEALLFGNIDASTFSPPLVVLFTAIPSEVEVPARHAKCLVVGTTSEEIDDFFASQHTLILSSLAVHHRTVHFAAMSCQHSAVKYIFTKLSLIKHQSGLHLHLLRTVDGRNAEHAFAIANMLIKAVPLGSAPRLVSLDRMLTVRLQVLTDPDFEKITHVWDLTMRVNQANASSQRLHKLSGAARLPDFCDYSFFQICIPKELFLDRPHLKSMFTHLAQLGSPVPFIGVRPTNSKEFFCFAVSLEGLCDSSYQHVVQELIDLVLQCRREHMLFAYAMFYQSNIVADAVYVRLDTANHPHVVEHCLQWPCLQLDRCVFLVQMKPLEFEKWSQNCTTEQVPHPHSVSTGASSILIDRDQNKARIKFLQEPGGLRSAVFQLRPLHACTAALQTEYRSKIIAVVRQHWPSSFGHQWGTATAPSGSLVQVLLLKLPLQDSELPFQEVGTNFCFLENNFVLEIHRQGYALPGTRHVDLPEEESATMHRVNLATSCKKQSLQLSTQSKGRTLAFVPLHSEDRSAKKTVANLAIRSTIVGSDSVLYDRDTCKANQIAPSAVYAGFKPMQELTCIAALQEFRLQDGPEWKQRKVVKQVTSATTQLHKLLPKSLQQGGSSLPLVVSIAGPHTLCCKRPSSLTNLGAIALHDVLHSTILVTHANVKSLSVVLASDKTCSVTIHIVEPTKAEVPKASGIAKDIAGSGASTSARKSTSGPPPYVGQPPSPVNKSTPAADEEMTDARLEPSNVQATNAATSASGLPMTIPPGAPVNDNGHVEAVDSKDGGDVGFAADSMHVDHIGDSAAIHASKLIDPVDIPVGDDDNGDVDLEAHKGEEENQDGLIGTSTVQADVNLDPIVSASLPASPQPCDIGVPLLACALFVALRMLTLLKWTKADVNDSLDWHLLHLVSDGALQTDPKLREPVISLNELLFPGSTAFMLQNGSARAQDAVEVFDKLCSRLLQKQYAYTTGTRTLTCSACGFVQTLDTSYCVVPYDSFLAGQDPTLAHSEAVARLFSIGSSDRLAKTCPCCNEATAHETERLANIADVLVLQVNNTFFPVNEAVLLNPPVTSTRGGSVHSLEWCATVLYDDTPGAEHYVLQQRKKGSPQDFSWYDPLHGVIEAADLSRFRICAHVLATAPSDSQCRESSSRGRVPVGSAKLAVIMRHIKQAPSKYWTGARGRGKRTPGNKNGKRKASGRTAAPCRHQDGILSQSRLTRSQSCSQDLAGNYGLISLFDGLSTAMHVLAEHTNMLPGAALLAENDLVLRSFVADILSISPHSSEWQHGSQGVPIYYANDVWIVFDNAALLIKQFISLLGATDKIVVVAGSPCQDATTCGSSGGLLGFTGPRSFHVHAVYFLLHVLKALGVLHRVYLILENAGSMIGFHKQYLIDIFGLHPKQVKPMNASSWSCVARNRLWFTSSVGSKLPERQASPFEPGWAPLCKQVGKHIEFQTLPPWLRCQKITHLGNPVRTSYAYYFEHMLYYLPRFGGADGLSRLVQNGSLHRELLTQITPAFRNAWKCMQASGGQRNSPAQTDAAALELADLFSHADIELPIRLPSIAEQIQESELRTLLEKSPLFQSNQVGEVNLLNFLGNYFKPSALVAAVSQEVSNSDLQAFLRHKSRLVPDLKPTPLSTIMRKYNSLSEDIRKDPRFKRLKFHTQAAQPCPTDYLFLLKDEYYDQLRLFSKVRQPNVNACERYKHSVLELAALSANQTPVYRQLPIVDEGNAALHASVLAKQRSFPVTFTNRTIVPDPSELLAGIAECHGTQFIETLCRTTIESFSRCEQLDVALIVLAPHLGIRRVLGRCCRVRSLAALVCNAKEACVMYLAKSFLPYEHPNTVRINARILDLINSLQHILVFEADVLAFRHRHACSQILSDGFVLSCRVKFAVLHLPHLAVRPVFFTGQEGHYQCDATSADSAERIIRNSPTAVASHNTKQSGGSIGSFAANFLSSLQHSIVHSQGYGVVCSFFVELAEVSPQLLEEVLLSGTLQGKELRIKFHNAAVSPQISLPNLLKVVGSDGLEECSAHWDVYVHLLCSYGSSSQNPPATCAVKLDVTGFRKLHHFVSSLLTSGIGEAHPV